MKRKTFSNRHYIGLLVFLLIQIGCGNEKKNTKRNIKTNTSIVNKEISEQEIISFAINKNTSLSGMESLNFTTNPKGEVFFSFLNTVNNTLSYFNIQDKTKQNEIKLEIEGPNGVGFVKNGQHIFNDLNEIYLFNSDTVSFLR